MVGIGLVIFAVILSPSSETFVDDVIQTVCWSVGTSFIATLIFYVCDKALLPKMCLQEAISEGNVAAGIFSGLLYVVVSIIAVAMILS